MEKYIEGNKEAWEEAFDKRDASWGLILQNASGRKITHSSTKKQ